MATALVPVLATVLAIPLLGETIAAPAVVGLVCVTAGLLIGVRAQLARQPVAPPAAGAAGR